MRPQPSMETNMTNQAIQTIPASNDYSDFELLHKTAKALVSTGFLPQSIKTPEQAIAIILTGRELGIGTMAALNTINVIQGKPTISPQLMLALIERSGQLENIQIEPHNGNAIRCTMKRRGRSPHTEYFGETEAAAMGLAGKDNYKKQAATMYKWRAVAACARVVFPDVILGLYLPDEMGADVDSDGEVVELPKANIRQIQPPPAADAEPVAEPQPETISISALCKALNAAGDDIEWNAATLKEYAEQLFDVDIADLGTLTDEQKQFLAEDLTERLDSLARGE